MRIVADYAEPTVNVDAFHCPHCGSYSDQYWTLLRVSIGHHTAQITTNDNYRVGCCNHCKGATLWKSKQMVYPSNGSAPPPNPDMPSDIKRDYEEARTVIDNSPRSACMLLRLCVEKICMEKVSSGGDLNEKIKKMVDRGLDHRIEKALDSVRVFGGEAVHPLQIDLKDDRSTATRLCRIVNHISQWAYTSEKEINDMFDDIPESKKNAINKRNGRT